MVALGKQMSDDDLRGFKNGQRPAYTRAMTEALSQVSDGDLDVLAYFVARTTSAAAPAAPNR